MLRSHIIGRAGFVMTHWIPSLLHSLFQPSLVLLHYPLNKVTTYSVRLTMILVVVLVPTIQIGQPQPLLLNQAKASFNITLTHLKHY